MKFSQELVQAAGRYESPFFLVDRGNVRQQYEKVLASIPGLDVFYAVKANPHPKVLGALAELGCGFEVSSCRELELALEAEATPDRIVSYNPVKTPSFLAQAHQAGMRTFAFDSAAELDKLASMAPGSKVVARLVVSNTGSEWPLCGKYGMDAGTTGGAASTVRDRSSVKTGAPPRISTGVIRREASPG